MSILFFDTETTGLPNYGLPTNHEDQPHVVQLAAILTDERGKEQAQLSVIIKPDGWIIPEGAARVHGITTEKASRYGIREVVAAGAMYDLCCAADTIVAHNIKFDRQIVGTMFARAGRGWKLPERQACTMMNASPIVNLPPTERMIAAGYGDKPKAPSLAECIRHFYGEELDGAHDALVDVRACKRIYFEMLEQVPA
ncbi:3'-5' exonuclease [Asaia sp. VD9]|uniref:3'-5' exonuclease n=1 Tax=Asaia sp. VD9 TaxID=3081235 RepID=UPI0030198ED4